MYDQIKKSHFIYVLTIQIDTKSQNRWYQFNNIKFSCFVSYVKWSLKDAARLLDTLEYAQKCLRWSM